MRAAVSLLAGWAAVWPLAPAGAAPSEDGRGISVVVPVAEEPAIGPGPQHRILYVNREGGVYSPGWDDSSENTSSILSQSVTIPPARLTEGEWDEVFACVERMYAPFAVTVTAEEPSPEVPYVEAVVGGKPGDAGFEAGVAGVSPIASDCSVIERGINYTFSDVFYSPPRKTHDVQSVCWTIAQESGHTLGLDHVLDCADPMSYLDGCGDKSFQDADAPCGEDSERTCFCGSSTQNAVEHLLAVLGPADHIAPSVELLTPQDGDTVSFDFLIEAAAEDTNELDGEVVAGRIDRVELWIDGALAETATGAPYRFTAPAELGVGEHDVEVRAYDGHENAAVASASVVLEGECEGADDCPSGYECAEARCALAEEDPPGSEEGKSESSEGGAPLAGCAASDPADGWGGAAALALWLLLAGPARLRRRSVS